MKFEVIIIILSETARHEQKQRNNSPRSQKIERHQYRYDEVTTTTIDQNCHIKNGRDNYE